MNWGNPGKEWALYRSGIYPGLSMNQSRNKWVRVSEVSQVNERLPNTNCTLVQWEMPGKRVGCDWGKNNVSSVYFWRLSPAAVILLRAYSFFPVPQRLSEPGIHRNLGV